MSASREETPEEHGVWAISANQYTVVFGNGLQQLSVRVDENFAWPQSRR